eukprot:TRINITY_DN614_c0_g3_i2.p1 TRINITY_DN614_c0_g3~~TRINITY_DN614_c0_g3_i2.p1  ORF type:complete len:539 (+),score=164.90 TRINITY_DN614_c0_g3_i2:130-1746(+)
MSEGRMEMSDSARPQEFVPSFPINPDMASKLSQPNILCCVCGASIQPNAANMCVNCLRSQVDITEGITKQITIFWCRGCGRYLRPPWVECALESRQLLALCLKKIKGLNKVKLIDASFVWTEPHSRRIKVKLVVQKEVMNGVILQQAFIVEFVVQTQQCDACQKSYTADPWKAKLQLRQKVGHKRTFFFLEQLILKHGLYETMSKIKDEADGLDFYFPGRSAAQKVLDFFQGMVPLRSKASKRLVSQDFQSNTTNYKYTIYAEIAPICKDDLIALPRKVAQQLGGVSPIQLCLRVTSNIHLIDPFTLQRTDVPQINYYKNPFTSLLNSRNLTEFVVLDVQKTGRTQGKFALAEAQVALASEMGVSDQYYVVSTHLGNLLSPGDNALGYYLKHANLNESDVEGLQGLELPDVVLVRKSYPAKNRARRRKWDLKVLEKEEEEGKRRDDDRAMRDLEQFKQELEEDPELRANVNIFKKESDDTRSEMDDEEEMPSIPLEEMMEGLSLGQVVSLNRNLVDEDEDTDADDTTSVIDEEEKAGH